MDSSFRGKKVLVTGGFGFVGTRILSRLSELGSEISVLSNVQGGDGQNVRPYIGDLKDRNFVLNTVNESAPDYILHLAADKTRSSDISDFRLSVENNLLGSLNLFEAVRMTGRKIPAVVIGTAEEYGNISAPFQESAKESPISSYSFSKLCVTRLCEILNKLYQLPFVVLRPSIAYGPGQGTEMFIPALIQSLLAGKPFDMTPGNQKRDFVYIDDLAEAILAAAVSEKAYGRIVNLGNGKPVTIIRMAKMIAKTMGKENLLGIGKLPYRKSEIMNYTVSVSAAKKLLGWKAGTTLEDGLKKTVEYYAGNRK